MVWGGAQGEGREIGLRSSQGEDLKWGPEGRKLVEEDRREDGLKEQLKKV